MLEPAVSEGPWWVHCWCGALDGEYPNEAEADAAVSGHVSGHLVPDRRCEAISKSSDPPGVRPRSIFRPGDDSCTGATIDQDVDGQWQVTCDCAALDSLRFPTAEEAEEAMDEHLDSEDERSRAHFERLAAEDFNGMFCRC